MIKYKVSIDYFDFIFDDASETIKFALMAKQHDNGSYSKDKRAISIILFDADDPEEDSEEEKEE